MESDVKCVWIWDTFVVYYRLARGGPLTQWPTHAVDIMTKFYNTVYNFDNAEH